MSYRVREVGLNGVIWRIQGEANERRVWFRLDGPFQSIGVRLTPDEARELAHALIIEADVAQLGAAK